MKNTFGNSVSITLFGESHGEAIGAVLDGIAPGVKVNEDFINHQLSLRRPSSVISTARREQDPFKIVSGVVGGVTTGSPICIIIPNSDTRSNDYADMVFLPRPSHADFAAYCKYHGFEDRRGGGHFSGRITAALVAAGAIAIDALKEKGILIGTHVKRCAGVDDIPFADYQKDIAALNDKIFATLSEEAAEEMQKNIKVAAAEGDSVGGILETAVTGIDAGVGEPWFDTMEGVLSHALFSVPAVKGIEFGGGFSLSDMRGSSANDPICYENGNVKFLSNNSGGINGGITNGDAIIFRLAIKPTPTISLEQDTINIATKENEKLAAKGRHDPCIVHRARVVADSITAIALLDMLSLRYGTDWLVK